jgi:hypothetical protein
MVIDTNSSFNVTSRVDFYYKLLLFFIVNNVDKKEYCSK